MKAALLAVLLLAERGNMAETRRKNDELIALAAKYSEMFPIASVHPYDDQAALEEVRRIAGLGVTLIKLHPHTQKFSITDPRVAALCQLAGQLGMIVLFDNANIVPGDSQDLFQQGCERRFNDRSEKRPAAALWGKPPGADQAPSCAGGRDRAYPGAGCR
jgi:predicted TIM-barrel fold metal-dependent hydrolase